ncbi:MAG: hypothetical protein J0M29_15245 [Chitinophagales bacterium]|nr:hypothetical protein [Chitinophagales bacterium]
MIAIAGYVFLGGLIQLSSSYVKNQGNNNLWLLHLYTPLEFICILWFYSLVLVSLAKRKWFVWLGLGFAVLSALNTAFLQPALTFNTYARSLEGILVIILCLSWCYQTLTEMKIRALQQDPVFWTNTGFLLYFSGNVLLFAFSNYILNINHALNQYIWAFHALFSILLYFFITIGLWKAR